jgi:ABC-type uncharacterized transport system auxiliary subunit
MKRYIILSLSILVLGSGCSSLLSRNDGKNKTHRYVLEYDPPVDTTKSKSPPWQANVWVRDFSITEPYRQNEIVYRESKYQMDVYDFELWALKPKFMISDMVFKHLRDAQIFQQVSRSIEVENVDYVLRGEITALEEVDQDSTWFAHLAMSMYFVDNHTQKVLWTRSWDEQEKLQKNEPEFVVRSLSHLLEGVVTEAVSDLDSLMAGIQPKSKAQSTKTKQEPQKKTLAPPINLPPPESLE